MVFQPSQIMLFPFVGEEHAFYPKVELFRKKLGKHPLYEEILRKIINGERRAIHTEIKGCFLPNNQWELNRFYWSFQYWNDLGFFPFHALTIYYTVKTGRIEYFEFPNDPYLTKMASYFSGQSARQGYEKKLSHMNVLRYVPLRRLTFRIASSDPKGSSLIGKFKRKSRFKIAYDRLLKVSRALKCSRSTFSIASPMGIDEKYMVYFQEERPGKDLASHLDQSNVNVLLHSLGGIHYNLHSFHVSDIPEWGISTFIENLKLEIEWILFFFPDRKLFFQNILSFILKQVPCVDPKKYVLCHGDFVPSQILIDGEYWFVIDFDLVMTGDPYIEIGKFIASLKYDVPWFEKSFKDKKEGWRMPLEEAQEAYLDGYQEKAQVALSREKTLWYWVCFEVSYLALMLKKDWFSSVSFERAVNLIGELTHRLQKEGKSS